MTITEEAWANVQDRLKVLEGMVLPTGRPIPKEAEDLSVPPTGKPVDEEKEEAQP